MTTRSPLSPPHADGATPSNTHADAAPWDLEERFGRLMEALDEVTGHGDAPASERGAITDAPLDPELQARLEGTVRAFLDETKARAGAPVSPDALEATVGPLFERLFATATGWAKERPELLGRNNTNTARRAVDVRAILDADDEDDEDGTLPMTDAPTR